MQRISQFFVSDDRCADKGAQLRWHSDLMKYIYAKRDRGELEEGSGESGIVLAKLPD
jgi:hypothetical protein